MDNNDHFDTVKVEKENATTEYRRVRNIANLFKLIEVFFVLALISWSSTRLPSAVKLSRKYLIEFSTYLFNPHIVFVIGNFIVISLYVISRHFDTVESDSASSDDGIVSEEYQKCSTVNHNAASAASYDNELSPAPPKSVTEERSVEDKQIVSFEIATEKAECEATEAVIETATRQIQRFQRTQSEKLKREISVKPRKEFRRSRTEIRRQVDISPNHHGRRELPSFDKVDRLSNEEFRFRVEAFIEKQQGFLKSQKLAEFSK